MKKLSMIVVLFLVSCGNAESLNEKKYCDDELSGDVCFYGVAYNEIGKYSSDKEYYIYERVNSLNKDSIFKNVLGTELLETDNDLIKRFYYIDLEKEDRIKLYSDNHLYSLWGLFRNDIESLKELNKIDGLGIRLTNEDQFISNKFIYNRVESMNNISLFKTDSYGVCVDMLKLIASDNEYNYYDLGCESYIIVFEGNEYSIKGALDRFLDIHDLIELNYPIKKELINN